MSYSTCKGSRRLSRRAFLLSAGFAAAGVAALASQGLNLSAFAAESTKLNVAASFYPMYDFATKIAGGRAEVSCLVPAGTEPHDWEPATDDIVNLSKADLLVYNGAGMESWVEDALESLAKEAPASVEASKGIELRKSDEEEEEEDGGAEGSAEHDHDHEEENDHDHSESEAADGESHEHHHGSIDPHVWLAPLNAKVELGNIRDALVEVDPDGKETYDANYETYAAEFDKLDQEYKDGLKDLKNNKIVVSHEAFGYLCDAYGLEQEGIEGINADSEPDAKRMAEIADYVRENNIKVIFSEELVSPKVAEAIASETGAEVLLLNPLEGLSDEEMAAGEDYFSVMRTNLEYLKKALA